MIRRLIAAARTAYDLWYCAGCNTYNGTETTTCWTCGTGRP